MVRSARARAAARGIANTRFVAITESDELLTVLPELIGNVNFLYSLLVFQHIGDFQAIASYVHSLAVFLSVDGIGYLQFDTRAQNLSYRLKTAAPDFLLPRFWRKGIRRIRRTPSEIEAALKQGGLRILDQRALGSAYHRYIVQRA
jgi:cyclopropane fatty-acyl-phospholipid synthase-like methyltransferase